MSNPWEELAHIDEMRSGLWDSIESLEEKIDDLQATLDGYYAHLDRLDNEEYLIEGKIELIERNGMA